MLGLVRPDVWYAHSVQSLTDTIVAPITAVGGAVALIRLSGSNAVAVARVVFPSLRAEPSSHQAIYGRFTTGDDGYLTYFRAPRSFTGEDSWELSIHGSVASVSSLLDACLRAGARMAEPGEFTYRAFMNGRLDLTQAEGVNDTVRAETDAQLRQANLLREGSLRSQVTGLRDRLLSILVAIEASTDFSEEIGMIDRVSAVKTVQEVAQQLESMLMSATYSHQVREGINLAIVGRPNAGKSSLFNAVLNLERSIVTDIPGTTRDLVSEIVSIKGHRVRLIDTAGLRATDDRVEQAGVERTKQASANADHVWYVFDAHAGWTDEDSAAVAEFDRTSTLVANKVDLGITGAVPPESVQVSAQTGAGIPDLLARFDPPEDGVPSPVNRRHEHLFFEALEASRGVIETLGSDVAPDDLATVGLRSALRALGEVTGETASPDVIERIFHDFCIGK